MLPADASSAIPDAATTSATASGSLIDPFPTRPMRFRKGFGRLIFANPTRRLRAESIGPSMLPMTDTDVQAVRSLSTRRSG